MIWIAVGDIHGCYGKLIDLLARCAEYAGDRQHRLIFLGDYIDRGPDSRAVVQCLMDLSSSGDHHIFLRGNHEEMLLHALFDDHAKVNWLAEGGTSTLASYSASQPDELPADHIRWLTERPLTHDDGLRLFVHAGVNPRRPLNDQTATDLLWIREPFLSFEGAYDRFLVHGHTPTRSRQPDRHPHRLNIDTGAAFGGPLTAAAFIETEREPVAFLHSRE